MRRIIFFSLFIGLPLFAQYNIVIDPGHGKWWPGTMGYEERDHGGEFRSFGYSLPVKFVMSSVINLDTISTDRLPL